MSKNNGRPATGPGNTSTSAATAAAKPARTRIALVLDRSGSMSVIREPARGAFNEAISRVQADARQGQSAGMATTLSVITFNHRVEDLLLHAPADKVRPLGQDDYAPAGMTALYDGVGHAIDVLQKAGSLDENDAALVIVISDGEENASRRVSQSDLVERMQKLEATEQWTFSFMMANVDITNLAQRMGTEASNYAAWDANDAGAVAMKTDLADGVSSYMDDRRAGLRSKKEFFEKKREVTRTYLRRPSADRNKR